MFSILTSLRSAKIVFFFWLCSTALIAQVEQVGRIEIPIETSLVEIGDPGVISLDSTGVVAYRRYATASEDVLELTRLDTTLQTQWRGYIPISRDLSLVSSKVSDESIFLLFSYSANTLGDFVILTVRANDGKFSVFPIKNFIVFKFFQWEVTPQAVWIGGYFNYRPLVLHVDLLTQKTKILPGFFNELGELTQLKAQREGTMDVILMAKNEDRLKCLWMRSYDPQGLLLKTTIIVPDKKKQLIFGRAIKTDDGRTMVVGVYGRYVDYSRGIFVSEVDEAGEYQTQYYNFADLKNFFSFLKARREQRIKDRIERKKMKGRRIKFNYRLLVHELVEHNNQLVMLGEAFYPHYSYRSRGFGSSGMSAYYGYSSNRGDLIFDGYQYTHAVVIGLDKNGKLKWDNSFGINDVKSFQLEQYVRMGKQADRLVMIYPFENSVRSKVISGNTVIEGKTNNAMKTNYASDFVKDKETQLSKLDYWYGNHFFVYGIQTIRTGETKNFSRKVFFINKLRFN